MSCRDVTFEFTPFYTQHGAKKLFVFLKDSAIFADYVATYVVFSSTSWSILSLPYHKYNQLKRYLSVPIVTYYIVGRSSLSDLIE